MKYRFYTADVFTNRPFTGNPLAVFPHADGLDAGRMQAIAKEFNLSEVTFVLPPADPACDYRVRIFTPGSELPMAGHPTIGSTFALALEGTIPRGHAQWVFELGVGPTPVSLEWDGHGLSFAWMTQPLPSFGGEITDRAAVAAACGVGVGDLVDGLPVQEVSCGVPFLFVPLKTRAVVDAVSVDARALARCCAAARLPELPCFVFTAERGSGTETLYSRMLAPGFGITEDPATGGASGPLGAYVLHHAVVTAAQARALVSLQGAAMKRPSRIHISIDSEGDRITRVRVGGQSVLVGRGEIFVDR